MPRTQAAIQHDRKKRGQRRAMAALYVQRVRDGLCPRCGDPGARNSQTCLPCALKDRVKAKKTFEARKRKEAEGAGSEIG